MERPTATAAREEDQKKLSIEVATTDSGMTVRFENRGLSPLELAGLLDTLKAKVLRDVISAIEERAETEDENELLRMPTAGAC